MAATTMVVMAFVLFLFTYMLEFFLVAGEDVAQIDLIGIVDVKFRMIGGIRLFLVEVGIVIGFDFHHVLAFDVAGIGVVMYLIMPVFVEILEGKLDVDRDLVQGSKQIIGDPLFHHHKPFRRSHYDFGMPARLLNALMENGGIRGIEIEIILAYFHEIREVFAVFFRIMADHILVKAENGYRDHFSFFLFVREVYHRYKGKSSSLEEQIDAPKTWLIIKRVDVDGNRYPAEGSVFAEHLLDIWLDYLPFLEFDEKHSPVFVAFHRVKGHYRAQ